MNRDDLVKTIKELHQSFLEQQGEKRNNKDNLQIISLIENTPDALQDDELIGFLARAYNNDGRYLEAIKLLNLVKEENRNNVWLYRMGYALHFLAYEDANPIEMFKLSNEYLKQIQEYDADSEELINFAALRIYEVEYHYQALESNKDKIRDITQQHYILQCEKIQQYLLEKYGSDLEQIDNQFEKDMLLLYRLESTMANGGFVQLLFNWGFENFNETGHLLERIKSKQHLNLLTFFAEKFKQVAELDEVNDFYEISLYMKRHEKLDSVLNPAYWELDENLFKLIYNYYQEEIESFSDTTLAITKNTMLN